jgi:hypothetical protein
MIMSGYQVTSANFGTIIRFGTVSAVGRSAMFSYLCRKERNSKYEYLSASNSGTTISHQFYLKRKQPSNTFGTKFEEASAIQCGQTEEG